MNFREKIPRDPKEKPKRKYAPAHGRDFEIDIRELDHYQTARTRDRIAYTLLLAALTALLVATVWGFRTGDFAAVRGVWSAAGPFIGGVAGYYFNRGRKDSE